MKFSKPQIEVCKLGPSLACHLRLLRTLKVQSGGGQEVIVRTAPNPQHQSAALNAIDFTRADTIFTMSSIAAIRSS
jgi:hypothetical protein